MLFPGNHRTLIKLANLKLTLHNPQPLIKQAPNPSKSQLRRSPQPMINLVVQGKIPRLETSRLAKNNESQLEASRASQIATLTSAVAEADKKVAELEIAKAKTDTKLCPKSRAEASKNKLVDIVKPLPKYLLNFIMPP
uniref:Uncharacterized protein n=1 Tax=Oryza punctata TaxID=4537 RepID=A0A0E0JZF1_ORYPU